MQTKAKRKIFLIVGYSFVFVGVIALLSFFVKTVRMPAWLSFIGLLSLGLYLLFQVLYFFDRLNINKKLKAMSLEELEQETFRFSPSYFIDVQDEPSVMRFKELVVEKDLPNLIKEWPKLSTRFDELPTKKWGHIGPYYMYEIYLKALAKRYGTMPKVDPILDEENPAKIIGKKFIIRNLECAPNGLTDLKFPPVTVLGFENGKYKIALDQEVQLNNKSVKYGTISARHVGHAVSDMKKSGLLAVTGEFDSGEDFIACINLLE